MSSDIEYDDLPPNLKEEYNKQVLENKARTAYTVHKIHTNRQASWEDLTPETRDDWRNKVRINNLHE